MPQAWISSIAGLLVGSALVAGSSSIVWADRAAQPSSRTVYVSVLDKNGKPVTDLDASEFDVKVGGKRLEVVRAGPAQAPLRIALIVSDAGTGAFQMAVANFMQKLLGHAEFALISLVVQPEVIVDYSSEGAVLREGVRRLGARGRQRGAQLMETIQEATKHVRREGRRPVIVVTRVGAEATTPIPGDDVREQLRKSGATLYVISTIGAQRQPPSQARQGISAEQAQLQDDEVTSGILNLAQVLGDGSRESGGRHDQGVSTTLVPTLEHLADELLNQYALECALPAGVRSNDKLSVVTKRKGAKIHAPSRLPN